jgi:YidC/Oxa1 family membrane protein insertase
MERRLLIAFALSFLVIMLSRPLWEPHKSPDVRSSSQAVSAKKSIEPEKTVTPPSQGPPTEAGAEPKSAESERLIEVGTDLYKLTLSNKEAVVKSWILNKYTDSDGRPLDLINQKKSDLFGYPLGLKIDKEEETSQALRKALFFSAAPSQLSLTSSATRSQSIAFEFSDQNVRVQKTLTFYQGSYTVDIDCGVWLSGKPSNFWLLWRSGFGDSTVDERMAVRRALYRNESKSTRLKASDVQAEQELAGSFAFVALEDQYFAAVFLPALSGPITRIQIARDEHLLENGKKEELLKAGVFGSTPEQGRFKLFVGPKDTEVLQQAGHNLIELIDYGWFAVVCKPLFLVLRGIYGFCGNYGVAIILLTILINLALFPLRYKSIVSAQKMQKLQPQMKIIQEKYKKLKATDPKKQQMNAEVMALYKQHGVNPLGGCLPLLLQMPFFIAFYNLLSVSIELRHAPFIFWIKDLSAADHTFVLPILMTVSMMIMQKMTPTPSADPIQAKMMLAMPLVFGFMLAFTSSGLVLYWLTSNLVGVVQQYLMNKYRPSLTHPSAKHGKKK